MNSEIQQAGQELVKMIPPAGLGLTTAATGISTYFHYIPPVLGSVASFLGILVTIQVYKNYRLKWRLMKMDLDERLKGKKLSKIDGQD